MSKFYLATVAAVVVTTSVASNLLVVGTRGSVYPHLFTSLRSAARRSLRRAKHVIDVRVAAMLARRERQAALAAFYRMTDRELQDMGLYRSGLGLVERYPLPPPRRTSIGTRR
jgi:hypothetical protein